jgi:hypothetical protein
MDLSLYRFRDGEPTEFDIGAARAVLVELGAHHPADSAGPCMFNTTDGSAAAPLWISRRGNHKPHVAIDCYIRSDRGFLTLLLEAMTKLELAAVYPEGGTIVFPLALSQHISLHLPPGMEPRPVSNTDELAIALGCL